MISAAKIINALPQDDELQLKSLEKLLRITKKNEKKKLDIALKALHKLNLISINSSNCIRLNSQNTAITGRIRCSSKGYCFAVRENGEDDIYIRDQHLNKAWHGDLVLVKITKEGIKRRSPEGVIQCILERNTESLLSLITQSGSKLIAKPLDDRLLSEIELLPNDKNYIDNDQEQNIVEVKVNRYPIAQLEAQGEVLRKLPIDKGFDGDLDIVLTKTNLQNDVPSPKISLKEPANKNRVDLTDQPCLLYKSWSSSSSPALPAIHVQPKEGGFRIWIHSQTVAERFNLGNKIDNWLKERTESLCLGKTWRCLLSNQISEAAIFQVNKVNDAISLCIDIDNNNKIINWNFQLTQIKPLAEVTPKQLIAIINRKTKSRSIPIVLKPLKDHLSQIESTIFCAKQINSIPSMSNSIELEIDVPELDQLSEMKWQYPARSYNGWKNILNLEDPQSILNIYIQLANKIWLQHSRMFKIPSLSIRTEDIDESIVNEIVKATLTLNTNFELNEDGMVNTKELLKSYEDHPNKSILHKLIKNVIKDPKVIWNADFDIDYININSDQLQQDYSPWCCPSLNYIDIINQYLILLLIRDAKNKPNSRSKQHLDLGMLNSWENVTWDIFTKATTESIDSLYFSNIVNHLNKKRIQTKLLRSNILSIVLAREAEKIIGQEVKGLITGVQSYGFFTEIPPLMIDGLVHVSSLQDDWYEYRSRQNLLIGRKSKRTFQLGDNVNVKILKVDLLRNQIDLEVQEEILTDNIQETVIIDKDNTAND